MKINTASLAIGIGIGFVIALLAVLGLQSALVKQTGSNNPADAVSINTNRTHFFMSGHIKAMTAEVMVLDQTFGHPEYTDNPNVKVRLDRGAVFLNCYDEVAGQSAQDPESCSKTITDERISAGLFVCALTRMYDGEFYAGKTWLDSGCGPFQNEVTSSAYKSSAVIKIPEGSSLVNSERNNFEPETITVVIGLNNTVTWINEDNIAVGIRAGDTSDPDFFNETESSGLLGPNETFSFTFAKPGNFTYYSVPVPHRHGTIVVQLPADNTIPTSVGLSQYEAIQIVENDVTTRQSDYDRINGIIVNNTSGYVRIEDFWFKNLDLPLVYVHPNSTLIRINGGAQETLGECNSGLLAYCGYLEPYNFDYKGRLVYGVEVLLWNQDNPPEAESGRGFPFLYIVDARTGEIVDSTFLREEWYQETQP